MKKKTQIRWFTVLISLLKLIFMAAAIVSFTLYAYDPRRIYLFCGFSLVLASYLSFKIRISYFKKLAKQLQAITNSYLNKNRYTRRKMLHSAKRKGVKKQVKHARNN